MTRWFYLLFLALPLSTACKDKGDDTGNPTDTDADSDSDTDSDTDADSDTDSDTDADADPPCTAEVVEVTPATGEADWYYLDPLQVVFNEPPTDVTFTLVDAEGTDVGLVDGWDDTGLKALLAPRDPLLPLTTYTFTTLVCDTVTSVEFTTNSFGGDLTIDPASLVGYTYVIDFDDVEFTEPAGVGAIIGTLINKPLLLGVTAADSATITLLATQGRAIATGGYETVPGSDEWEFPPGDFTAAPFFLTEAEEIVFTYSDVSVPVENFHVEGTFSPDGSAWGGGRIWGLGDTRDLASYFGSDDPSYVCNDVLGPWGIPCEACADGETYCVYIAAEDIVAPLVPGLTL